MPPRIDTVIALQMHADGKSDSDIARHFGVTQSGATRWRHKQGLAGNVPAKARPALTPEQHRLARKMLRRGDTAEQVGQALGFTKRTILKVRKAIAGDKRLRGHGQTLVTARRIAREEAELILRELQAATRHVSDPALRDDVIGEMYLDLIEGRLARDRIKAEVRRYSGQALNRWQSRWAPVSIDEDMTGDGFRLADLIPCPSAAAWVESVGA